MKTNIVIVGFLRGFNEEVCKKLADQLNMFYADISDLVAYELSNQDEMITICGQDYYDEQEKKTIQNTSTFENTIFNFNYDYFYNHKNYKSFKKTSHIIYLKIDPKKLDRKIKSDNDALTWATAIDVIDYADRDKFLMENADFVAYSERLSSNLYIKEIKNYLLNLYSEEV